MIVPFLFLINYLLKVIQSRIRKSTTTLQNNVRKPDAIQLLNSLEFEGTAINDAVGIRFLPPAFSQRYTAVYNILVQLQSIYDIKKIVDLGCSEISFFTHIKGLESIEEYIGVDIDEATLLRHSCRAKPLNYDYLSRRCSPLKVSIFHGSATEPDVRLKYTNAVVAIELIEHMYPPELDDLPYNIFGVIQPDVAIFTTPNADFNVLFTTLKPNTFRHYDHKFEWTRQQFEDWGHNLALRYPNYEVWFNGIGRGPVGTEEFGCCSQIAVFVRKEVKTESSDFNVYYKTVHEVEYPFQTREEKLNDILEYDVYQFIDHNSQNDEYLVGNKIEIPLVDILKYISIPCPEEKLKTFLEKADKHVELKNNELILVLPFSSEDNNSLSDHNEVIEEICDGEESWINANNDVLNDFVNNDETWSYVLEDVNEMKPQSKPNYDPMDDVNDLVDELDNVLRNPENDVTESGQNNSAMNVMCDPKQSGVNDLLLSDEEDLRADSVTPVGENQVQYLNIDSILQHSGSTGSGNTSKSSDTLVDHTLSPMNKIKNCTNDDYSEKNALSPLKNSFSDKEEYPCSSTINDAVEISLNISNPFHENDKQFSCDVLQSESQKEINENKTKNLENSLSSAIPVGESNRVTDTVVEEVSNSKEVHYDQSTSIVTRSQSLENINLYKCKEKCFRYSLNIDNKLLDCDTAVVDMDLETCKGSSIPSLTETYGSHSKAVDSGYPNSTQDMDLDLTPEQVDEIITETESSLEDEDSSADERVEPVHGNPPIVFADNVENGDVANNNRDGEGNNMEGGQVLPEELIFEGLVIGGEEVEAADEHESDDDGLFLSALDVSNDTIVPEEMSSNEDTVYLFDLPSPSSFGSLQVEEPTSFHNQNQFPSWLLNMEVWEDDSGSGDAGPDRDEDSSDLVVDREGQVDFYPGDARAGGEPTLPDD
ncbi:uncharacterized protein Hen1 [Halyomorpha halys]|uniref:uncharacterized protein Hen1 n=1 Tax=Halyomorpha halys TaxID=286706 RepID=UPI0006D4F83F|nr:uncharacterized protein LOC106685926 [Halyomorpha halys]